MTRWRSPYGKGRCALCPADAVVVVVDRHGDTADLCGQHWQTVRQLTNGSVRADRFIWRRQRRD
jgi:hypothetical protein